MKKNASRNSKTVLTAILTAIMALGLAACASTPDANENLISNDAGEIKAVNLFGPMEKSKPNATNVSRNAFDRTVEMAEDQLGLTVEYRTYTAENYQEKTYDDVVLDRVRDRKSVV